ncbi:hypothetical protein LWI29_032888 [Acer saccharum]|uniref:Reverse transcriptase Ty1/copia-type domain-containing protein n=1 Tax=Acer saccharum TaxID=4024 RepID=A0AA39SAE4_ACESA|nr:hypothetical protein LWI29_032888 [Acer saccharum]
MRETRNQTDFSSIQESEPNSIVLETDSYETVLEGIQDQPIAVRKGYRECRDRPLYPLSNYVSYERLSPQFRAFVTRLVDIPIPNNIQEALKNPEWKKAVMIEVQALEKNGTWELTELPKGKNPVGCKWVFTVKTRADGSVERLKARLVAKGFT